MKLKTKTQVTVKIIQAMQRHARSIPAYMGYTPEQFRYRDRLNGLDGKVGIVTHSTKDECQVNFNGSTFTLHSDDLEVVE